ncbi:MAG: polysaccharide biosynthesis C-terminal domain-containing protein [Oscillospiraceae bacterium]
MKKQTFIQGSIVLIVSALIVKIIGALFKIPLANMLGGNGMNYFGCGYSLFLPIYAIMINGLSPAVSKLTAERVSKMDYHAVEKIRHVSLISFSIIGLVGSAIMVIFSKVFCTYVADNPKAYLSVVMLAPSVLFGCICSVYRGYYEGLCNMMPTSISQLVEALAKLIFGLTFCNFAINHYDSISSYFPDCDVYALASASAIFGISLSTGFGLLILLIFEPFRKKPKQITISIEEKKSLLKELFSIMIPIAIGSLMTNLTTLIDLSTIIRFIQRIPSEVLSQYYENFNSIEDFSGFVYGSYTGLAITIFNLVPSITNMLSKGALPNVVTSWQVGDKSSLKKDVSDMMAITSLIAVPSGLGITFLSKQILLFLYPQRLDEVAVSWESLAYMGVGVIFLCLSFPLFSVLQGINRADLPIKIMLVGVIIKLLGNIVTLSIPRTAIYGAGISTSICYVVIFILSYLSFVKVSGVKVDLVKIFLPISYGSILCSITALISNDLLVYYVGSRLSLMLGILFGGVIYLITLYLMNFRIETLRVKKR